MAATMSSPMASASAAATPSFGLPAMPGSYEDFEFSLNLPENITASDLDLVASPDFSTLFGVHNPSSLFSSGMTPVHSGMGSSSLKSSAPSTPRAKDADDVIMTSHSDASQEVKSESAAAPHASSSTASSATPTSAASEAPSSATARANLPMSSGPSVLGLVTQPQPTSMPMHSVLSGVSSQAPFAPSAQAGLFGNHFPNQQGAFPTNFMSQQQQHQQQLLAQQMFLQQQQHHHHNQPLYPQQRPAPHFGAQPQPSALFDANETNFLTNFLSGFEGWDFNPNLPMDLPSFAEAEKSANQAGTPPSSMLADGRRNSRQRSAGGGVGARAQRGSPHSQYPSQYVSMSPSAQQAASASDKKKMKTGHGNNSRSTSAMQDVQSDVGEGGETDKRSNHILSEQRRRNHIREAFKELVDLLEAGREYGARGLGLSSGTGTGIEDEGLDDRSDYESTLEDEEPSATSKRRKFKARKRAAMEAARKAGAGQNSAAAAALLNGGGGRGKGRGRGGSAGGGAGSKSAVLFQAVDLLHWLDGRNEVLTTHIKELEDAVAQTA